MAKTVNVREVLRLLTNDDIVQRLIDSRMQNGFLLFCPAAEYWSAGKIDDDVVITNGFLPFAPAVRIAGQIGERD